MTDFRFRALCAELLNCDDGSIFGKDLVTRAEAALKEAEGKKPTEDQLDIVVIAIQSLTPHSSNTDSHNLEAVDRGRRILQRAITRWGRPAASAVELIPVSERLPDDADCLVIPPHGTSTFSLRYCWMGREIMHCGQARLLWDWKLVPHTTEEHWPFTYWLPATTQFLPTTVDPAQPELRGSRGSITLLQVGASCGGGAHLTRDQCHYILNLLAIPLVNP